jgi:hypothetical protein
MSTVRPPFRIFGEEGGRAHNFIQETRWRPRDHLAAVVLFGATAGFTLWQNLRVAVLWDLGYLLDTSWRIALGQMPYRDFPLAHAPLTFLIQAGLIHLLGRHYLVPVAYAALAGALGTVVTWRILLHVLRMGNMKPAGWAIAFLLAAPLCALGIYSIYPHPIYDCDGTLAIVIAIGLLAWLEQARKGSRPATKPIAALAAGAATVPPLFFKQNIGMPFLSVVATGLFVLLAVEVRRTGSRRAAFDSRLVFILAGMAGALFIGFGTIAVTTGLGNYFHWTVQFAAQRRMPGLSPMLGVYDQPSLVWMLPTLAAGLLLCHTRWIARWWARVAAFCLIAAPFAGSLIFLLIDDDADERADNLLALWPLLLLAAFVMTLGRLIPFFVLAAIHGTLLSQQLWGSTYALWPLLVVLAAFLLTALPAPARPVAIGGAAVIAVTFLVCGVLYAVSLERLSYVQIPEAPLQRSSMPALSGMTTPGPYLSNFDELTAFTAREIPTDDALLPLPGEDPFYYATGRIPKFPVTLFDPATDPYSAAALMDEVRRRNVRWIIVKRELQINGNPMPEAGETMGRLTQNFALYRKLRGYDIYMRKQANGTRKVVPVRGADYNKSPHLL